MFVRLALAILALAPYLAPVIVTADGWVIPDLAHGYAHCEPWRGFTLCTDDSGTRYVDGQPAYL